MVHELKIYPEHFKDITDNGKNFEVRKNDRDFASGDCLALNEWIPDKKNRMALANIQDDIYLQRL